MLATVYILVATIYILRATVYILVATDTTHSEVTGFAVQIRSTQKLLDLLSRYWICCPYTIHPRVRYSGLRFRYTRKSNFKIRVPCCVTSWVFFCKKKPDANYKISPSSDNIFCSNFQDRPGWIRNAQIRCLLFLPPLWGYFPLPFISHAPKNLESFWKIADLKSETTGFHDGSTRINDPGRS